MSMILYKAVDFCAETSHIGFLLSTNEAGNAYCCISLSVCMYVMLKLLKALK